VEVPEEAEPMMAASTMTPNLIRQESIGADVAEVEHEGLFTISTKLYIIL
jgi:hypothetical protein